MPINSELFNMPQLLLIAGQQQNAGKTTLACRIISHSSRTKDIIALKISPHFHKKTGTAELIKDSEGWHIYRESYPNTNKDTSRMLQAGASESFFLQTNEESTPEAFSELLQYIPKNNLIVCESGNLRDFLVPGVFLYIRHLNCKINASGEENIYELADRIITFTINGFDFSPGELSIENNKWKMLKTENFKTT